MKFCQITKDNIKAFAPFIPSTLDKIRNDKRCLSLGFFEDDTPLGAVVLFANNAILEVRSFDHLNDIEDGVCEKALAEFVTDQNWKNIYRIEYVVGGTEEFLAEYDFTMLDIGFIPMEGDVRKFSAPLYDIVKAQGENISAFKKTKDTGEYILGKNLTRHQIDSYNNMYPYNRYFPDEKNGELSVFLVRDTVPLAGIFMTETDDRKLEFQWMDARGQAPQVIMKLIFFTLVNALSKYPKGTEVIICPFTDEVKSLIAKFGFDETNENIKTRIYSYYL